VQRWHLLAMRGLGLSLAARCGLHIGHHDRRLGQPWVGLTFAESRPKKSETRETGIRIALGSTPAGHLRIGGQGNVAAGNDRRAGGGAVRSTAGAHPV
jgi:hypothetical protein